MDYLATIHNRLRSGPVSMKDLSLHVAITFSIPQDVTVGYILGYIHSGFLVYNSNGLVCMAYNPNAETEPYVYSRTVKSACWSCDKEYEKEIPPALTMSNWECKDCDVKWSMPVKHKVNDNDDK